MRRRPADPADPLAGARSVAAILNSLPPAQAREALAEIQARDPDLAARVQGLLFTFEDLAALPARTLRDVLGRASSRDLLLALKGAPGEIQERLLGVLSRRTAQTLREDLEALGPARLTEVEAARAALVALARRLEAEGAVDLGRAGEEAWI